MKEEEQKQEENRLNFSRSSLPLMPGLKRVIVCDVLVVNGVLDEGFDLFRSEVRRQLNSWTKMFALGTSLLHNLQTLVSLNCMR